MTALNYLQGVGLSLESAGDRLRVSPAALITEAIGQFIRDHKAEILAELASANAGEVAAPIPHDRTEPPVEQQHTVLTAATASPAWRMADAAFIDHLMGCRACHAATGRYCAAGASLRQRYITTPMT